MKTIKIIIITMVFVSISLNMYGFYVSNQGCKAFNQCDDGNGVSTQSLSLGQMIPMAAGHYLQSLSDFQSVLKIIELSETGLNDALDQTIQSMVNANALYYEIWIKALSLEYDPTAIQKLSQFDYNGYKLENNLNSIIFQQVEDFLKCGHVREVFKKHFEDSSKILEKLKEIKTTLEAGKKVDISNYWRLNQIYLDFALFGQYTSEVFVNL